MSVALVDSDRITSVVSVPVPGPRRGTGPCDATLTLLTGRDQGALFTLRGPAMEIGRDAVDGAQIDGVGVSRRHARLFVVEGVAYLEDLGSTNGTYVDGVRITAPVPLSDGDRIQLGSDTMLRFGWMDQLEQEATRRRFEMSLKDGLTGLYGRRAFDERLTAEMAFADRHRTPVALIVLDLDHFKRINDTFGHPCGDRVLCVVSAALVASVRTEDLVARYGGEELAVVVRGVDLEGARTLAERLRSKIEALDIVWEGRRVAVTASLGLAHSELGRFDSAEAIVACADRALYEAKRAGRNRLVVGAA